MLQEAGHTVAGHAIVADDPAAVVRMQAGGGFGVFEYPIEKDAGEVVAEPRDEPRPKSLATGCDGGVAEDGR